VNLADLGEFGLIERLAGKLAASGAQPAAGAVDFAIGDDASLLRLPPGTQLVTTIDALIEGIHFRRDWSLPEDLGWKALAVNVSDLGAMGARPLAALISVALPPDVPVEWIDRLYRGLAECAKHYGCPLVGGDTVRAPQHLALSVTALGSVPIGKAVRRAGARVGDLLGVTGTLGESGAGLELLQRSATRKEAYASLYRWHLRPQPPVSAGAALAEAALPTAMMDLSDGLGSDLRHLTRASGVGATLEAARLPLSDATRQAARELGVDPIRWALFGGEDYQLLFTIPPDRLAEADATLAPLGIASTVIGEITPGNLQLRLPDGTTRDLRPEGFHHFAGTAEAEVTADGRQ
jgi:thiamine-monophosphate kinase